MGYYKVYKNKIFILVIVILALGLLYGMSKIENDYIVKIDSEIIEANEFKLIMNDNIANTVGYFSKTHNADSNEKGFWTKSFDGEIPLEVLKDNTLDLCINIKLQQMISKEKGIVENIDYESFVEDWKNINEERLKLVEEKKPIYGPVQYKEREYYEYILNTMQEKVKEYLVNNEISFEIDVLNEYYNKMKEVYFKNEDTVKVEILTIPYNNENMINAKDTLQEVKEKIISGEDITNNIKDSQIKIINREFRPDTAREDEKNDMELKNIVYRLKSGEVSEILEDRENYYIIKCLDVIENGYKSFEEVKGIIKKYYVDDEYEKLVNEKKDNSTIEINKKAYSKIKIDNN